VNWALRGILAGRTSFRRSPRRADNHQHYQQAGNSQPMGGRGLGQTDRGGPCPRRRDVSPDPCRPAVVTRSAHRHSPQQTGRGRCCRAGCKIAECGRRRRPKRPSPRQIAVRAHVVRAKRPPNFTIPWSGSIAGGRLPTLFVALAVDWFKMRSGESRRWRAPQLTKWFDARRSAALAKSL
jgi:hypothetical protein